LTEPLRRAPHDLSIHCSHTASLKDTQLALKGYQLQSGEAISTNAVEMNETSSLDQLEHRLEEEETTMREALEAYATLEASRRELQELLAVLNTADQLVSAVPRGPVEDPLVPQRPGLSHRAKKNKTR
jgi:hypothetical protein